MSSLKVKKYLVVGVCILLVGLQNVMAKKRLSRGAVSANSATRSSSATANDSCGLVTDFSTVEASIRSSIFLGDAELAADLLRSRQLFSMGAGYTYRDNETCLVTRTEGYRAGDPDIVAKRALVHYAENYGDTEYLAQGVVLSFELACKCSLFTAQEKDEIVRRIQEVLDDPVEREAILNFGFEGLEGEGGSTPGVVYVQTSSDSGSGVVYVPRRSVPVRSPTTGGGSRPRTTDGSGTPTGEFSPSPTDVFEGRRLTATEVSPTNSFYCAFCEPTRVCRRSGLRWCQ